MTPNNNDENLKTAGYCGLACKACSIYIASKIGGEQLAKRAKKAGMTEEEIYCTGCRSDKTSPYCTECGIKKCIRAKGLKWCSECQDYPCALITEFQSSLPHRAEIISSLDYAKEHSVEEWEEEMHRHFACGKCGAYNSVYADACHVCGNSPSNDFSKRHWDQIKDSPERL